MAKAKEKRRKKQWSIKYYTENKQWSSKNDYKLDK
jgi:hypothetical protein